MTLYTDKIAERERELHELESLKEKVEALEARPSELRGEIEQLRHQEREDLARAEAVYLNSHAPFIEARDAALALLPQLADAIEKARDTYADVNAAYRTLVNVGIEPTTPKPDRSDLIAMADRDLSNQFTRLKAGLESKW